MIASADDLVGRTGVVDLGGIRPRVRVLKVRRAFGRLDVLVTATDGAAGAAWIQLASLALDAQGGPRE